MSLALLILAHAAALTDCETLRDPISADRCRLDQSMQLDPPPNCKDRATQFDLNVCSFREYLQGDIELNRKWVAVEKRWKPSREIWTPLLAGQRAWLNYRDKQCSVWEEMYKGGTMASLAVNSCLIDITRSRSNELNQMLDDN